MKYLFWLFVDVIATLAILLAIALSIWDIPDYEYKLRSYKKDKVHYFLQLYKDEGIKFDSIVVTQNFLETGDFTSAIYKENKNMFGMKYNQRGFAKGVNRGHAKYNNEIDAVRDYAQWQKIRINDYERYYNKKIVTYDDYYDMLNHTVIYTKKGVFVSRYAEDVNYTDKLKRVKNQIFNK